jgi:hypothetical protein
MLDNGLGMAGPRGLSIYPAPLFYQLSDIQGVLVAHGASRSTFTVRHDWRPGPFDKLRVTEVEAQRDGDA